MKLHLSSSLFSLTTALLVANAPQVVQAGVWSCADQAPCIEFRMNTKEDTCGVGGECAVEVCMYVSSSMCDTKDGSFSHMCSQSDSNGCARFNGDEPLMGTGSTTSCSSVQALTGEGTKAAFDGKCEGGDDMLMCQDGKPGDTLYWILKDGRQPGNQNSLTVEDESIDFTVDGCTHSVSCKSHDKYCSGNSNQAKYERTWSFTIPDGSGACPSPCSGGDDSSSGYACELPARLADFNMVIKDDMTSAAHTYTKNFAVGGTFKDIGSGQEPIDGYDWWTGTCDSCNFNLNGDATVTSETCSNCNINKGNNGATYTSSADPIEAAGIDWGHLEWLANHLENWESRPELTDNNDRNNCSNCHKISILTETSSSSNPLCLADYMVRRTDTDDGKSMIVVPENGPSEVWLDNTCNTKPGPVILAPWATVYLKNNAGYQDGAVYAKNFVAESSSLQLHGDSFVGTGFTCSADTSGPEPGPDPTPPPTAGPTSGPTSEPTSGPTSEPTSGPTQAPQPAPVPPPTPVIVETPTPPAPPTPDNVGSQGDPHFKTWKNEHFEYHGQCDLVLAKDPNFADGLGIDVQIRTRLVRFWSYIKNAAVRIGNDVFEVEGFAQADGEGKPIMKYWYNMEANGPVETVGGFPLTIRPSNLGNKQIVDIDLSSKYPGAKIEIQVWKEFVKINFIKPTKEAFGDCVGMLGDFESGKTYARDRTTEMHDYYKLGNEWQVLPTDVMLFHKSENPQFPSKCIEPEDPRGERRRRLEESSVTEEQAEKACAALTDELDRKDCVYDIIATQDMAMAGAY